VSDYNPTRYPCSLRSPYSGFPFLGAAMDATTTRMWVCDKCLSNLRSGTAFLLF
jgi:hypothetical protein